MPTFDSFFSPGPYNSVVPEYLFLINPTKYPIAFKVKTTAPTRFEVKPVTGIVAGNESVTVMILMQPLVKNGSVQNGVDLTKQRFLIESAFVEGPNDNNVIKIVSWQRCL